MGDENNKSVFDKLKATLVSLFSEHKQHLSPALVGAFITLILSPFSIFLGFWLNNVLSRPILSIQHASVGEIVTHPKIPQTNYSLTLQLQQLAGADIQNLYRPVFINSQQSDQLINEVENWAKTFRVKHQNIADNEATLDELKAHQEFEEIIGSDLQVELLNSMSPDKRHTEIRSKVRSYKKKYMSLDLETSKIAEKLRQGRKCEIYASIMVLNKGGTEGLIKSKAKFLNENSEEVVFLETDPPPSFDPDSLNAVPTFITNKEIKFLKASDSVGSAPERKMTKFWFRAEKAKCGEKIEYIILESHIGNKMKWKI